jgi:sugar phosphate isomerase/epimerase
MNSPEGQGTGGTGTDGPHGPASSNRSASSNSAAKSRRHIPVALSTASVYPLSVHDGFAIASDLGYDGVEVLVTHNGDSQNSAALTRLAERYEQPILAIHAPTLLLTQQVWGSAWNKVQRSAQMAVDVGADVVVVHPPFRWQNDYAETFAHGVRDIADAFGVRIAVENMYPWRVRGREAQDVTWDFSHAASAGASSLDAAKALGSRLRHIHLTDGISPSTKDQHLIPGHGTQECVEVLQHIANNGFDGAVVAEISTRKAKGAGQREEWLAETLEFARVHLGQTVQ